MRPAYPALRLGVLLGLIFPFTASATEWENTFTTTPPPRDKTVSRPAVSREAAPAKPGTRWMAGHYFLKSSLVATPFVAPYVSSSVEAAYAKIRGTDGDPDIKAVGLTPAVTGQFLIADAVGVELGVGLSEILGIDAYSALVLGANFSYSYAAAVRVPVLKHSNWVLTPILGYGSQEDRGFSPINAALEGITTQADALEKGFLISSSTTVIRTGLLAGYTLSPVLGLQGELSHGFATTTSDSESLDIGATRFGIAVSTNFRPWIGVPIGVLAAFRDDLPTRADATATPLVEFGIFEMLHSDFNFGIAFTRLMTADASISSLFSLSYYY